MKCFIVHFSWDDLMGTEYGEVRTICHICNKVDKNANLVPATITRKDVTWAGSAHLDCIKKYNKSHKQKYNFLVYDENNKFVGEVTPI